MISGRKQALVALAAAGLAVPAAAVADPGNGNGHGKTKAATYNFKGTYAGDGLVSVDHGSGHARKAGLVGVDVQFDLSTAQLNVADTNGDGVTDAADILVGDRVQVQARLPKGDPGDGPYAARKLADKTNPGEDEPDEEPTAS